MAWEVQAEVAGTEPLPPQLISEQRALSYDIDVDPLDYTDPAPWTRFLGQPPRDSPPDRPGHPPGG